MCHRNEGWTLLGLLAEGDEESVGGYGMLQETATGRGLCHQLGCLIAFPEARMNRSGYLLPVRFSLALKIRSTGHNELRTAAVLTLAAGVPRRIFGRKGSRYPLHLDR